MIKKISFFVIIFFVLCFNNINTTYASDYDFKFNLNVDQDGSVENITIDSPYTKNGTNVLDESVAKGTVWNKLLNRYKVLIMGIMGFAVITLIGIALFNFVRLSAYSSNSNKRVEAIIAIAITFLAAGILGAGTLMFGHAYNVFK